MKTKNLINKCKALITLIALTAVIALPNTASAAIIFQDDDFHDIVSPGLHLDSDGDGSLTPSIKFGNDATASENGNITWDITNNEFDFDHSINVTGGIEASGYVNLSGASATRLREFNNATPSGNVLCTYDGEIAVNQSDNMVYICTTVSTSPPAAAGSVWTAVFSAGSYLRSDTSDSFTSGTLTLGAGTTLDATAGAIIIQNGTTTPATCTEGELFFETDANLFYVCSGTNTWSTTGSQDFESIFTTDADGILTTSDTLFGIATGTGEFDVTSTGLIDFNSASFTLDTTGTFSIDGVGASNVTTSTGNLTLSTTTSGDVDITGATNVDLASTAGDVTFTSGDDIIFDDAQLSSAVQLTDTATAIAATYGTSGIIDALNSLASTANGAGASNIGVEDSAGNYTATDVEGVLTEIAGQIGSGADNNEDLTFYPEYPDAVIWADGTNNKGKMESLYDDTNDEHSYRWTSQQATTQDMSIKFRFPLPPDFSANGDFTYKFRTGNTTEADNDVEVYLYNATNGPTLCASDTTNGSATWATGTLASATISGTCTGANALDAGDIMEIEVKLFDNTGATDFADIGVLKLVYTN